MNSKIRIFLLPIFFILLGINAVAQQTFVPDDNFEQALIDLGYDSGPLDDFVPTANIISVSILTITNKSIAELTGIEDFTGLVNLRCDRNQLTSLDLSSNTNLEMLTCNNNQLASLNLSTNVALEELNCGINQLTNLDVSTNTNLSQLWCNNIQLINLDLRLNTSLRAIRSNDNQLTSLDIRNGNNMTITDFRLISNPDLTCIAADDPDWSEANWTNRDAQTGFGYNCSNYQLSDSKWDNGVDLNWQTATEFNNHGFEIQKSQDGITWRNIGFVNGQGTTSERHTYHFKDQQPFQGDNYYRLRQIDFDGKFEYSSIAVVAFTKIEKTVDIYPNPSNRNITIQINNPQSLRMQVFLTNYLGQPVWQSGLIENTSSFIRELTIENNGLYFISTQIGKDRYTERVTIN